MQLGDAPYRATILLVKYVRLCPEGPWSCCVTMGACRLSVVPFQGNPRILVSSEVTYLPLIGSRCTDLAFRSRPPRFHVPTSDQDSRGNTRVLVHHPFCERKHLRCVRLPKDSHERRSDIIFHLESRHAPGCVTYTPSQLDTVTQQLFSKVWTKKEIREPDVEMFKKLFIRLGKVEKIGNYVQHIFREHHQDSR